MCAEARRSGLLPREAPVLSTFTPDIAAGLPGAPWLRDRRTAAAEAFSSSPLPSPKDEVWRYSRIDQLDLDRFRPAGTAQMAPTDEPGPSPSERVHVLVDGLGPRSGLVVTVNGALATLSTALDDRVLTVGRATDHPEGRDLIGSVASDPHDFPLLNDAFAIDPLVIDVQAGATVTDPLVIVHVVTGPAGGSVFPRTFVRAGVGSTAAVVEILVDANAGVLGHPPADGVRVTEPPVEHLVVPLTELMVADDADARVLLAPVPGCGHLADRTPDQHHRGPGLPVQLRGRARRRVRPAPHRLDPRGRVGNQPAACRLHRPGRPDARLPDAAGPPCPADDQ